MPGYGWRKDSLDWRDHEYTPTATRLPASVDLANLLPACWDQRQLGSCTSFGVAAVIAAARAKQGLPYFEPSHLFIYYNERVIEGTVNSDSGAEIRDGIKVIAKQGSAPEALWPYTDQGTRWRTKPPAPAYAEALKHTAVKYARVSRNHLRAALAHGLPVVFGFSVFSGLESQECADTGVLPMPAPGEKPIGGHCVAAIGYDDARRALRCRNSWGAGWGDHGHFWMPYEYVGNRSIASDFWQVSAES